MIWYDKVFKKESCRNDHHQVDMKSAKKKKRNLQLPQEIENDQLETNKEQTDLEKEEEANRVKEKEEEEEKEKSVQEYLNLSHE